MGIESPSWLSVKKKRPPMTGRRGCKNRTAQKDIREPSKKRSEADQEIVQIFEAKINGYGSPAFAL